jgi:hypothetical protein
MRVNYCAILNLEKVEFYYLGNLPQYRFIILAPVEKRLADKHLVDKASKTRLAYHSTDS